ncbi:MAG: hypothetical protein KKH98_10540, partial [Spirochaetes bacterium]|nr:hypothetical protein [Spirochaetota bacterium]
MDKTALKKALKTISSGDLCESTFLNEVYIMLSLDCNLKCDFCIWWGREGPCHEKKFLKKYSPCLTLKEFRKLASDVAVFNPYMVTFSGGEPLLYEKWHLPAQY